MNLLEAARRRTGLALADPPVLHRRERFTMLLFATERPFLVVKLARRADDNLLIARELENLARLAETGAAPDSTVPRVLGQGSVGNRAFGVFEYLPGRKAVLVDDTRDPWLRPAARWLAELAVGTLRQVPAEPARIREELLRGAGLAPDDPISDEVEAVVQRAVCSWCERGATIPAVFAHNDFTRANLLVQRGRIGVVDWGNASPTGLPLVDLVTLAHHWLVKGRGVEAVAALGMLRGADPVVGELFARLSDRVQIDGSLVGPACHAFAAIGLAKAVTESARARASRLAEACDPRGRIAEPTGVAS